ncbi:Gfo/Idh/MocA family oxidoreductase [Cyclobacteriaceae bacterium]|nr:Gfo/Idh/MocA family oxidoreductase [Cyclobacteriaceae bacterium]
MITNLIIGAGQLGSRHLQGLLKFNMEQVIYVLDPSENSLNISKERAQDVENKHNLIFINDWDKIPSEFDLVIIATGANVRSKVVMKLLTNFKVKNLILEKVLFQDLSSYSEIANIIKETSTSTWVNHARRMFDHYQKIKSIIAQNEERVSLQVYGGNWGLACNGLHFIDLVCFLSNSEIEKIDFDGVEEVIDSKRFNNIEFTGSIKGKLKNRSDFSIFSLSGHSADITVCIFTKSNRWLVQEGGSPKVIHLPEGNNFNEIITPFVNEYQSNLTTKIINDILVDGNTSLPTYDEASSSHVPFINGALNTYIKLTGIKTSICPIT